MESSPADHRARERHKRLAELVVPVVADAQPLELVHQGQRLLDVPAEHAQAAAVRRVSPGSDQPRPAGRDQLRHGPVNDDLGGTNLSTAGTGTKVFYSATQHLGRLYIGDGTLVTLVASPAPLEKTIFCTGLQIGDPIGSGVGVSMLDLATTRCD